MNDLKNLLELALGDGPAGGPADPAGDIARGRALLRRRARNRALGAAAATAVIAAAVAVPAAWPGTAPRPAASGPAAASSIRLVAYTGAQPAGYVVKVIPAGWVIQGSNPYALVIAPAGDSDKNPDSFLGKLVVTQEDFDRADAAATGWVPLSAAGRAAYYSRPASADGVLTTAIVIQEAPGRWLLVQAPASLGWGESALTQFGLGVTILATAQEGQG